jgi:hypothetical protein
MATGGEEFTSTERFAIRRRIGEGGMGIVYEAEDQQLGGRVALKTLSRLDAKTLYQLKAEFRALSDVVHPNLAALHELFSVGKQCFFTMELVNGVTFVEYVRSGGKPAAPNARGDGATQDYVPLTAPAGDGGEPLPAEPVPALSAPAQFNRLRAALRQLAEAVCALHAAGKLHRDIKPSNVLVTPEGRVVLLDFGLVADLEESRQNATAYRIAGTIPYMAPEQAVGLPLTPASDWYSVGVMLYEVLTGRRPFVGPKSQVLRDKQRFDPRPPGDLTTGLPEDLNDICVALLRRRPEQRPSGPETLRRLGGIVSGEPPPRRHPARLVGRERHLAVLREAYHAMRQGRTVSVWVHGQSGVGKSVLLQRFLEGLRGQEGVMVLAGRCYERESVPYKALDSLVDALGQYLEQLPAAEAAALLPGDVAALARLFPVLGAVRAVAAAPATGVDIPNQQELRRHAVRALRGLVGRLGERGPLVCAIDDLQWGDTDSAALLADLLRPPHPPALLLVLSYRSEHAAASPCLRLLRDALAATGAAIDRRELPVDPLAPDEARVLVQELLGPEDGAARDRAEVIAREAGGLPYFIQELAASSQGEERWDVGARPAGEITLDEVLWRRVQRLPAIPRRLLEVVTVAGGPVPLAGVYRAAGLSSDDHAALRVLRVGHLVRSTGPAGQDEVEMYHDRIRETVAAHLPRHTLKTHHRELARALQASPDTDPETLAVHWHGAEEHAEAGHYYALAADQAAEALAFDRAANLYRLALDLKPLAGADGRSLRTRLAGALANAGRGPEAARAYQEAAADADTAERLDLERRAAYQFLISGHFDDGRAGIETVLRAVGLKLQATPRRALLSLLWRRCRLRLRGLGFRERDPADIPAAELLRLDVCWSAAIGLGIIDIIRAADFQARALLLALRAGDPSRVTRGLALEAIHTAAGGGQSRQRTARLLEAADDLARRLADPYAQAVTTLARGAAAWLEGRFAGARELLARAEGFFRTRCTGVAWELDSALTYGLLSVLYLGDLADLRQRAPVLLQEAEQRGDLFAATTINTFIMTMVLLARDDPDAAEATVRGAMAQWSQDWFHVQHVLALVSEIEIALYRGDGAAAWGHVERRWRAYMGSLMPRVQYPHIQLLYSRGRSALAAAAAAANPGPLLRQAARAAHRLERIKEPWSQALAGVLRGGAAAARGKPGEARARLARALAGLDAAGTALHAAAVRRCLGQLVGGAEGRELVERANAWMAGQGITDPARMAALFVPGFGPS